MVGPKIEPSKQDVPVAGTQYHVKNIPTGWIYEEKELQNIRGITNLLRKNCDCENLKRSTTCQHHPHYSSRKSRLELEMSKLDNHCLGGIDR
jgi:hypothetical protein